MTTDVSDASGRRRTDDPSVLVDLARYPVCEPGSHAYRACVDAARAQLRATGAAELPGFVSPAGVETLARDADALAPRAHPSGGQGTAYLEFPDFTLPEDHPRLHGRGVWSVHGAVPPWSKEAALLGRQYSTGVGVCRA